MTQTDFGRTRTVFGKKNKQTNEHGQIKAKNRRTQTNFGKKINEQNEHGQS